MDESKAKRARELAQTFQRESLSGTVRELAKLVLELLPSPNPVRECIVVADRVLQAIPLASSPEEKADTREAWLLAALNHYVELGCPNIPELEPTGKPEAEPEESIGRCAQVHRCVLGDGHNWEHRDDNGVTW